MTLVAYAEGVLGAQSVTLPFDSTHPKTKGFSEPVRDFSPLDIFSSAYIGFSFFWKDEGINELKIFEDYSEQYDTANDPHREAGHKSNLDKGLLWEGGEEGQDESDGKEEGDVSEEEGSYVCVEGGERVECPMTQLAGIESRLDMVHRPYLNDSNWIYGGFLVFGDGLTDEHSDQGNDLKDDESAGNEEFDKNDNSDDSIDALSNILKNTVQNGYKFIGYVDSLGRVKLPKLTACLRLLAEESSDRFLKVMSESKLLALVAVNGIGWQDNAKVFDCMKIAVERGGLDLDGIDQLVIAHNREEKTGYFGQLLRFMGYTSGGINTPTKSGISLSFILFLRGLAEIGEKEAKKVLSWINYVRVYDYDFVRVKTTSLAQQIFSPIKHYNENERKEYLQFNGTELSLLPLVLLESTSLHS